MDKKSFLGFILIAALLFVWSKFFAPVPPESPIEEEQKTEEVDRSKTDSEELSVADTKEELRERLAEPITGENLITRDDSLAWEIKKKQLATQHGIFYPSAADRITKKSIVIENDKVKAYINPVGGKIVKVVLKDYKKWNGDSLVIMDEKSNLTLDFPYGRNGYLQADNYVFEPQGSGFIVGEGESNKLTMRLNTTDPSKYIEYTYAMEGGDYEIDFSVKVENLEDQIDLSRDDIVYKWDLIGLSNERSSDFEDRKSTVFYKYLDEDREYLSESKEEEIQVEAQLDWVAMKQYFFSAVAIPENGFSKEHSTLSIAPLEDSLLTKKYGAELALILSDERYPQANIKYFFGPNHYKTLKAYDNGMDRIVDLGWGIFGWMNKMLVIPVFNFLSKYINSYGIIILLLTVFIKMLLFPLTYKNFLSSAKMKVLKPEITALNEKFKDDAMKKQQATMSLYRQSGVNPMAGCVPMLIQMPVLYAMFNFFPSSIELRQKPFLWANDLSSYDSIMSIPSLPIYGDHISLFTILMAISTLFYTKMNSSQMPEAQPGMPNMQSMMYIFPFIMLFFFNNYPSGLSYYYLLANLMSIAQMFVIKKYIIDEDKIRAKIAVNKAKPKKKSKFQQRLEEAAKQQAAQKKRK